MLLVFHMIMLELLKTDCTFKCKLKCKNHITLFTITILYHIVTTELLQSHGLLNQKISQSTDDLLKTCSLCQSFDF